MSIRHLLSTLSSKIVPVIKYVCTKMKEKYHSPRENLKHWVPQNFFQHLPLFFCSREYNRKPGLPISPSACVHRVVMADCYCFGWQMVILQLLQSCLCFFSPDCVSHIKSCLVLTDGPQILEWKWFFSICVCNRNRLCTCVTL